MEGSERKKRAEAKQGVVEARGRRWHQDKVSKDEKDKSEVEEEEKKSKNEECKEGEVEEEEKKSKNEECKEGGGG
eukprot:705605-Hanusia_phi.AAC.1